MVPSLYDRRVETLPEGGAVEASPCPVCRTRRARPRFRVEAVASPVVVCEECGLGRYEPMLEPEVIRDFYPETYYRAGGGAGGAKFLPVVEAVVRAVAARHIAFLSRGLPSGARILDVGCGRGVLLGPLADRGFAVAGVEISEEAVQGVDPRAEVRIADRLSKAGFEDDSFDQVVIWHVLEHMLDPRDAIEASARLLRPGGRLIVAVPNFSSWQARWSGSAWFHLDPPRHLYHFPVAALARLLEDAGFEVRSAHHFSLRQNPFGWIQSALNRHTGQPLGGLYTLLHDRGPGRTPPFGRATRLAMWAAFALLAPVAVALSVVAAWARSGATVHLVATRREGASAGAEPASSRSASSHSASSHSA